MSCNEGIRHPEELSLARILSADELKRNQGISATRRSRPSSVRSRSRSRSSGGQQQFSSTTSILDSLHGSSLQLGSPSCRRTPSMFTSRVCSVDSLSRHLAFLLHTGQDIRIRHAFSATGEFPSRDLDHRLADSDCCNIHFTSHTLILNNTMFPCITFLFLISSRMYLMSQTILERGEWRSDI